MGMMVTRISQTARWRELNGWLIMLETAQATMATHSATATIHTWPVSLSI